MNLRIRPAVVLFGDSITQYGYGEAPSKIGWVSLLSGAYQRRADILNRGFSGYTSRHALELVPRVFGTPPPDSSILFCTVFFGANDASLPGERQHVPLEEYGDNLDQIITSIRKLTSSSSLQREKEDATTTTTGGQTPFPIIVMTPPPIDRDAWKAHLEIEEYDRNNEITRQYGLKAQEVTKQHSNCVVLDTWELLGGADGTNTFATHLCDGLHLSDSGNQLVYDGLMDLIQTKFPNLVPQPLIDGEYKGDGIPMEEKLWGELC